MCFWQENILNSLSRFFAGGLQAFDTYTATGVIANISTRIALVLPEGATV
jgi:hypothetical protein